MTVQQLAVTEDHYTTLAIERAKLKAYAEKIESRIRAIDRATDKGGEGLVDAIREHGPIVFEWGEDNAPLREYRHARRKGQRRYPPVALFRALERHGFDEHDIFDVFSKESKGERVPRMVQIDEAMLKRLCKRNGNGAMSACNGLGKTGNPSEYLTSAKVKA